MSSSREGGFGVHICECACACLYMGVCPHVNKDCVRLEGKSYLQNLEINMAVVPSKRARMSLHLISSEEFEGWECFLEAVTVKLKGRRKIQREVGR